MKLPDPKPILLVIVEYTLEDDDELRTLVYEASDQADVYKILLEISPTLEDIAEQKGSNLSHMDISVYDATITASMSADVINKPDASQIKQLEEIPEETSEGKPE